ncbi:OmpA family protein [Geomobilimonas luticola]|uniref:OmpA family protein n=1 Tax=Geomobilimonas luticola TaxID=1114878 RepID=A0ABS5SBQ4_9BACT|nr:OmpA family protein [Geomobilimonas luticola]MBT0652792.1 OmpA family protein [Geomobilimonas luticola]
MITEYGMHRIGVLLWLTLAVFLPGCAGHQNLVVLVPEEGKTSGKVTVSNPHGSQVLKQPWEATKFSRTGGGPSTPMVMDEAEVRRIFAGPFSAMPLPPARYLLYFEQNTTNLTPESTALLPEVIEAIDLRQPAELSVIGHTDTVGSPEDNYQLGLQRAGTVTDLLKSLGATPAIIETGSHGKGNLLIMTGDETPEPRNRRVEVIVR